MNQAIVSLGSNVDKEANLPLAVKILASLVAVRSVSSVYETVPVGTPDQPNYFNAAVLLETDLSAQQLKCEVLSPIEEQLNRVRQTDKNAPRTIDLDIALFNDEPFFYTGIDGRLREIPDPDLLIYPHVAVPAADVAPDLQHPITGEPLSEIATRLEAENPTALMKRFKVNSLEEFTDFKID